MDYYILTEDVIAVSHTPAHAFASHDARASFVAKEYARTHPLEHVNGALTEDNTIILISHLQAAQDKLDVRLHFEPYDPRLPFSKDDYRFPFGEQPNPAQEALNTLNRLTMGHGQVGTSIKDEDYLSDRLGDYDMALKGLMVILYRYGHFMTESYLRDTLLKFVPQNVIGGHVVALETFNLSLAEYIPKEIEWILAAFEDIPETENHLLMINSTRYLANQILFDWKKDETYDNHKNGLTNWLLNYMHTIAKHDFLEFNSRPYQRLSLHALLNLYEFAKDDKIKTASRILLDYTMMKFAISSNRQRRINPFRRLHTFTNRSTNAHNELQWPQGEGKDALIGFFLMYLGPADIANKPTDDNNKPMEAFPAGWGIESLIAGLSNYRPPVAAYDFAMKQDIPNTSFQHRFYHGKRPVLPGTNDQAEGGLEIYYNSPSFLLTAGGMFLNSGYGGDEVTKYKQTSIAQSTTLLPTKADVRFADLIRFDPYPDERLAVNTAVHMGFACGANLRPSEKKVVTDTSTHAPSLSSHDEQLFLAWKGSGNENLNKAKVYTTDKFGMPGIESLEGKVVLGNTSEDAPAIAFHNGRLFLAYKGAGNDNLNLMFSDDDNITFIVKKTLRDTSPYAPALISHGGHLFLAWTGVGEGRLNVAKVIISDREGLSIEGLEGKVVLDDTSEQSPALASHNGQLFLAFKGSGNNNLNLMFSDNNGTSFLGKKTFQDTSPYAPAVTSHGNHLFLAWTGEGEGKLNVAKVVISDRAGLSIEGIESKAVLDDTSEQSPSLASHKNRLILAWKGSGNDNLNLFSSLDGSFQIDNGWLFLDLNDIDLYVAIYRTPPAQPNQLDPPPENLGMLYVYDRKLHTKPMFFETFVARTKDRNETLPEKLTYGGHYVFHTADDHHFNVWLHPSLAKYQARVTCTHEENPVTDFTTLSLVEGPYLDSPGGHEGYITISHPNGADQPLILNFMDAENPVIEDDMHVCPQPWVDRAEALLAFAQKLKDIETPVETEVERIRKSAKAMCERVKIYEHLAEGNLLEYQPKLAIALFELVHYYRTGLNLASALTFAQQCVKNYEELAGLRPPESQVPVDYEHLDTFAPNQYWDWPYLLGALQDLAWVHQEAGDQVSAAAWTAKRIKIYERLLKIDLSRYQLPLGETLFDLLYYHRAGLEPTAALFFAKQSLELYEELAGLRSPESQAPVDYEHLGTFVPNKYWDWPFLSAALHNLAWVHREAGDQSTAVSWVVKRVKVYELLNQINPIKYASSLAKAQADVTAFSN